MKMKYKKYIKYICMTACISGLMIITFMIILQLFSRIILVKHLGINNTFTKAIFWGNEEITDKKVNNIEIDWEKEYPFSEKTLQKYTKNSLLDQYISSVDYIKEKLDKISKENLVGYSKMIGLSKKYDVLLGWNLSSYDGTQEMSDGYWTQFIEKEEMNEKADSVIRLNQYCIDKNIRFLYVQAPYKVCKYDDKYISGIVDFSNQNADELIMKLSDSNVSIYDLREVLHKETTKHHELFFRTDHHWLPTTGLWASKKILDYLNEYCGYHIETSLLNKSNFEIVKYPDWFLGSSGKEVSLARTRPDNFSLIYPQYPTDFHYTIPSMGLDKRGDFSITYDMDQVEKKDYYHKIPYASYNYGDQAMINIENKLNVEDKKILLVKDSFGDCVAPFLALGIKNVDVIDLRHFKGSLETYINVSDPDAVIILYNPSAMKGEIKQDEHTSLFDFR